MDAKARGRATQPQRRTHKNVSTGCDNCKRRHVKCDEGQPGCQRCQRVNICCAGYHPPKTWIFDAAHHQQGPTCIATTANGSFQYSSPKRMVLPQPSTKLLSTETPASTSTYSLYDSAATLHLNSLGISGKQMLLDIFLTLWVPGDCLKKDDMHYSSLQCTSMASWPLTVGKIAMQNQDDLVIDAILSLTLCLIGKKTKSIKLAQEAMGCHIRTLTRFQERLFSFTSGQCCHDEESSLACLVATGICCAQFEFISESLSGYNQHLVGTGSVMHSYWPSNPITDDTRRMSLDHRFLRAACAMVRRRGIISSASLLQEATDAGAEPSGKQMPDILILGEQLPQLLEEYEFLSRAQQPQRMLNKFHRLKRIVEDMEQLMEKASVCEAASKLSLLDSSSAKIKHECRQQLRGQVILSGYLAAFMAHAVVCMLQTTHWARQSSDAEFAAIHACKNQLEQHCRRLANDLCRSVDFLVEHENGMMVTNPALFFVDTAWLAYKTSAQQLVDLDLGVVRQWFSSTSYKMKSMGIQPLRDNWNIN